MFFLYAFNNLLDQGKECDIFKTNDLHSNEFIAP